MYNRCTIVHSPGSILDLCGSMFCGSTLCVFARKHRPSCLASCFEAYVYLRHRHLTYIFLWDNGEMIEDASDDMMFGDVWMCLKMSNMSMQVKP